MSFVLSSTMSDFRYDPFFDQWVCIAESRQQRPVEFRQQSQRLPGLECPFCPGNEPLTPPALAQHNSSDGWVVRVFPNKYPALGSEGPESHSSDAGQIPRGCQEVIVVSPRHVVSLADLNSAELRASADIFRQRLAEYWSNAEINHASLFMNCRPAAGASIEHAHFQLIGSPICTQQVRQRVNRMVQTSNGQCRWQSAIDEERTDGTRVVDESEEFVVFCPRASRYTGQLRFARLGCGSVLDLDTTQFAQLGEMLSRWTRVVERVLEQPAYNVVFYLPPRDLPDGPWFVDLIPRFPQFAGFELATDCWVNPWSPESAAQRYRN